MSSSRSFSSPRRSLALLTGAVLLAGTAASGPAMAQPAEQQRVTVVVVLSDTVRDAGAAGRDIAQRHGGELGFVYEHALKGFSLSVPAQAVQGVGQDRRVASVERDQVFTTAADATVPTGVRRAFATTNTALAINGVADVAVDADIAIIDTGLDSDHPDLNIAGGTNCASGGPFGSSCTDGTFEDGNGHGTHVGGSAAAVDNGIGVVGTAPGARLHGVRVLGNNGSGYTSWIIAGIDWVAARADTIEVANMSLGCECTSSAQDTAIAGVVDRGVTMVVAAGNSAKDAVTFNPANHPDVVTVSALADFNGLAGGGAAPTCRADVDDTLADFSNFGSLVEIAAPGVCIESTWLNGGYNTISGTSMASPHVAGAAAVLASTRPNTTQAHVEEIRRLLVVSGNDGWTGDRDSIKEPLLDMKDESVFALTPTTGGGGGSTNTAPVADFSFACTDLSCTFTSTASDAQDTSPLAHAWAFGDGATSSSVSPTHRYGAGRTYTVTLTVTDSGGLTSSIEKSVTVTAPAGSISLTATPQKVKGTKYVDLAWSGATSTVDVFRNGAKITTVSGGTHTDTISGKGGGTYTYRVCNATTTTCSNDATVIF